MSSNASLFHGCLAVYRILVSVIKENEHGLFFFLLTSLLSCTPLLSCTLHIPKSSVYSGARYDFCVPVFRFLFILLGPRARLKAYHEIGRAMATLLTDEVSLVAAELPLSS